MSRFGKSRVQPRKPSGTASPKAKTKEPVGGVMKSQTGVAPAKKAETVKERKMSESASGVVRKASGSRK